eukprot:3215437-Lingulodinium_polyedra.AAC.1
MRATLARHELVVRFALPPELPVLGPALHHEHGRGASTARDEAREIGGLGRALLVHNEGRVSALPPGRHGAGP